MKAKKSKVLRPSSAPVAEPDSPGPLGSVETLRPADAGGEVNLAGLSLAEVGAEFVALDKQLDEAEKVASEIKKKLKLREDVLIEQMLASGVPRFSVKSRDGSTKTIYTQKDWIVSKGTGITGDQLFAALRDVGFGDLVGETVNAQTLKATAKEAINRFRDAVKPWIGADDVNVPNQPAGYCRRCLRFYPPSEVGGDCPACVAESKEGADPEFPGVAFPLVAVIDGIPSRLRDMLYIEEKTKVGMRAS